MSVPRLEARGITKTFPGVRALSDVALRLAPGEVLAVVGENGAGKSTLMKILAGVQGADTGEVLVDGQPLELGSVPNAPVTLRGSSGCTVNAPTHAPIQTASQKVESTVKQKGLGIHAIYCPKNHDK